MYGDYAKACCRLNQDMIEEGICPLTPHRWHCRHDGRMRAMNEDPDGSEQNNLFGVIFIIFEDMCALLSININQQI